MKLRNKFSARFAFAAMLIAFLFARESSAQSLLCRKSHISGFEDLYKKAKKYIGPPTSKVSNMEVFISIKKGVLYLHSNYLYRSAKYPTKLVTSETRDLRLFLWVLIDDQQPSNSEWASFEKAIKNEITVYVDEKVLKSSKFKNLDFSVIKKNLYTMIKLVKPRKSELQVQNKCDLLF